MNGTLTVRLPARERIRLKILSKERGVSMGDLVRDAMRRYLALQELAMIRRKLQPLAERKGILTDEDVFGIVS